MKTKTTLCLAIWLLISLSACQKKPQFINHTPPNLAVSMDVFSDSALLTDFGCKEIQAPPNLLGGLDPAYPIAICVIEYIPGEGPEELAAEIESGQFIFYTGGLFGNYLRYIVYQNGEFVLLKTEEDMRKLYAPIESPDEALSYVLAVKRFSAYYGLTYDPAYEYEVDIIEDTYVTPESDGHLVHLFYDQVFGCGPHWIYDVDVHVSADGIIEQQNSRELFRDPSIDDLCVD